MAQRPAITAIPRSFFMVYCPFIHCHCFKPFRHPSRRHIIDDAKQAALFPAILISRGNKLVAFGIFPLGEVVAMRFPGNRQTVERLVNDHYMALYRYAYRLSGSAADADDLTQEAFCKA